MYCAKEHGPQVESSRLALKRASTLGKRAASARQFPSCTLLPTPIFRTQSRTFRASRSDTTYKMSNSCEPLLAALKDCLLHSDCVLKQGHLPSECLRDHTKELPEQCLSLRQATFECKRGLVRYCVPCMWGVTETLGSWTCGNVSGGITRELWLKSTRTSTLNPLPPAHRLVNNQ